MSSPPAGDAQAAAPPDPPVPPVSNPSGDLQSKVPGGKTTLMALGVGIGIGGAIVLLLVCIFGALWYRRRNRGSSSPRRRKDDHLGDTLPQWKQNPPLPVVDNVGGKAGKLPFQPLLPNSKQFSDDSITPPPQSTSSSLASAERPLQLSSFDVTAFSYGELAVATDNFASTNLLGQGGFGYVFKGIQNGMEVAVKQLKVDSGQGEREFQAEVETISRVHHKHLVSLVGYCSSGDQRLLVYEFLPNKTLEFHLHETEHPIDWENRVKIAMGAAKGLAYLHEKCHPKIIHRDIKASNILLDNEFEAKVADFGLARFYPDTDTHVSTRVMGTFGYLAPEYAQTGKLTDKSDVFSFGVMLLELITGRRPIDKAQHYVDHNIVDWARPLLAQAMKDGNFDSVADPRLQNEYDVTQMARMVMSAAVSIRQLGRSRPRMSQVVRTLEGKISLEELDRDVGTQGSSSRDLYAGSGYPTGKYREDLEKFRKMALDDADTSSGAQTSHSIS